MFLVIALVCFWVGLCGVISLEYTGHSVLASGLGVVGWVVAFSLTVWNGWLSWCIKKEQERSDD